MSKKGTTHTKLHDTHDHDVTQTHIEDHMGTHGNMEVYIGLRHTISRKDLAY